MRSSRRQVREPRAFRSPDPSRPPDPHRLRLRYTPVGAETDRYGHNSERIGEYRGGAGVGLLGRRDPGRRLGEHRRHRRDRAAAHRRASRRGRGPATAPRRTTRRRRPRTTGSCRSTRTSASRRRSRRRSSRSSPPSRRIAATVFPASAITSDAGSAAPIGTPTTSCASTIAAPASGTAGASTSRSVSPRRARPADARPAALPLPRHQPPPRDDRPLHDARRGADGGRWKRPSIAGVALHPPFAFLRNYILRGGFKNGSAGFVVSVLNSYYVFLKLAKAREMPERLEPRPPLARSTECSPSTSTRPGRGAAGRTRCC